ncbi:MAG TPA: tripartite tricarboxylate transporter substrate binding protein [Falsiroseomonas sp.]|jgi:tripartite-type tricarboxylate transporter receptor subunit TctC|nr:tripartite tricarboxylate transporter substrate binding protein [Falsiroseomonas sp.]
MPHPSSPSLRRRLFAALALLVCAPALPAAAQPAWPSQPIRIVVPFGPGGGTDISIRAMAPRLSEFLGVPVVIENRPGAGSTVGTDHVAKSAPDGYTYVHATLSSTGIAAALYRNLPYDPVRDLAAVAPTIWVPLTLCVTTRGWNIRTAEELISTLRASPGRYQFGSNGVGATGHLASANFATRIGAQLEHVPYRSGAQTIAALLAGEIHYMHDIYGLLRPHHESGQARCLFVTAEERSDQLPGVPTMREAGVPEYRAYSWFGLFAAAATPRPIINRMAAAVEHALADTNVAERLNQMGTPPMRGWTPERFAAFVQEEVTAWRPLVEASGARAD